MPIVNNSAQRRQFPSIGGSLGSLYGRLRGFNPFGMIRGFGNNFRNAAGIPANAPLWTKEGGIQLGNLPTTELQPDLSGLSAAQKAAFESGQAGSGLVPMKEVTVPGNGTSLGTLANWGSGIYQGGKALKGIYDNIQSDNDIQSLKNDINLSIASNPMYDMYLDAADEKLLRQMRNNTVTKPVDGVANGVMKGLPQAGLSALIGGAAGGIPGALINGIGSLVNSGISGYGQGNEEVNSKLQGLYDKLRQAQEEYRSMRRPRGLSSAGLQSRYFNELY